MKHFPTFDYVYDNFDCSFDNLNKSEMTKIEGEQDHHHSNDPSFNRYSTLYLF